MEVLDFVSILIYWDDVETRLRKIFVVNICVF